MKTSILFIGLAAGVLSLACCGTGSRTLSSAVLDGEWTIVQVDGRAVDAGGAFIEPFLGFDTAEKRVYGSAGCNRLSGSFETDSLGTGSLDLGGIASTRMLCPDMALEDSVLDALARVKSFKPESGSDRGRRIALCDAAGNPVLLLEERAAAQADDAVQTAGQEEEPASGEKEGAEGAFAGTQVVVANAPVGAGALEGEWTVLSVNGAAPEGCAKTPFVGFRTAENELYGNAGCNSFNGGYTVDPQQPRSLVPGALAATMMMCPTGMETERAILIALDGTRSFEMLTARRAVLYDENGNVLMELEKKAGDAGESADGNAPGSDAAALPAGRAVKVL